MPAWRKKNARKKNCEHGIIDNLINAFMIVTDECYMHAIFLYYLGSVQGDTYWKTCKNSVTRGEKYGKNV